MSFESGHGAKFGLNAGSFSIVDTLAQVEMNVPPRLLITMPTGMFSFWCRSVPKPYAMPLNAIRPSSVCFAVTAAGCQLQLIGSGLASDGFTAAQPRRTLGNFAAAAVFGPLVISRS